MLDAQKGGQLMGPSFRGQGRRDSALSGTNLKVVKEMGEWMEFLQCLIIWEDVRDAGQGRVGSKT